jgi:hypothetical protein
MQPKQLFLLITICTFAYTAMAQEYQPFKEIGKKVKVLTLSNGKYDEFFDYKDVQRIGSVMFNIRTKKIVKLLNADSIFKKFSDNSSASRWYSVDPLAAKGNNISYSPYTYTFNNPVNYIDPDGQDGIRVIDEKNKTITIKAVYYVQSEGRAYVDGKRVRNLSGYSEKQIASLQKNTNEYLNGLKSSVTEGDFKGYKVQFDLQFKAGGDIVDIDKKAADEKQGGFAIGNSFARGNKNTNAGFETKETDLGDGTVSTSAVGGVTADKKGITMNVDYDDKMNRVHEIFHTLGFDHPKTKGGSQGIMKYPPDKPTQTDINQIGNNSFLPVVK